MLNTWLINFISESSGKPVVTVGTIRNMTNEHISIETMTKDFERELINAGTVRFIQSKEFRDEIREEREEQQQYATPETAKKMRAELHIPPPAVEPRIRTLGCTINDTDGLHLHPVAQTTGEKG